MSPSQSRLEPFHHLLLALDLDPASQDLTPGSRAALDTALWIATASDARVEVLHSIATDRLVESHGLAFRIVHEGLSEDGRAALEAAVARFADAELAAQLVLSEERPPGAIAAEARRRGVDLVLVGRHDRDHPAGTLGNVARGVLRDAPSAVWAVRAGSDAIPRRILVGTDLGEVGQEALARAVELAEKAHGELHVVHAFQIPLAGEMRPSGDLAEHLEPLRAAAEARLEEQLAALAPRVRPAIHVACTTPLRAILGAVERLAPDLVVLGTVTRKGIPGLLLGNTAERVLSRVETSLLAVPPEHVHSP